MKPEEKMIEIQYHLDKLRRKRDEPNMSLSQNEIFLLGYVDYLEYRLQTTEGALDETLAAWKRANQKIKNMEESK